MNVSGKRAIFECRFSSGGCGGRTALELCALEVAPTGSKFPMLGGSPRYPQREHRDRYHKPEKNDSLECHHSEQVLELPMVQNTDLPGSWWGTSSRGCCGLCLRATGGAAADLPIDCLPILWKESRGTEGGERRRMEKRNHSNRAAIFVPGL